LSKTFKYLSDFTKRKVTKFLGNIFGSCSKHHTKAMLNLIFNFVFSECKAWLASKDDDMLDDDMIMF
jgi:hypothetical protein